jgi:hypothetical protein
MVSQVPPLLLRLAYLNLGDLFLIQISMQLAWPTPGRASQRGVFKIGSVIVRIFNTVELVVALVLQEIQTPTSDRLKLRLLTRIKH